MADFKQPICIVDAFTDRPFAGNPAAVCPLAEEVSPTWMQSVAAEMNLSETAFVHQRDGRWNLRWFTPTVEVDLCGHYPVRGVIVTARAVATDFVSRFFAPACGIPEDPVTGSAHCALGPYWAAKLGRNDLVGFQASARGGRVKVSIRGDRVVLGGTAVTVLRGDLAVPLERNDL
jgi:predicted PhzF superfamily epimerase YddE/YHI9